MQNTHKELAIQVVHIVAPTAHWGHKTPATTSIYPWFTQRLLLLTGDTELTKCWALYDVDVKWLPGLTEDSEWQELSRSTSRSYACKDIDLPLVHTVAPMALGTQNAWNGETYMTLMYSGSQGSVGITKVYNGPTYMPCINNIVAPVAHWGPRTLEIKSCTWRWYAVASGGHWGRRASANG